MNDKLMALKPKMSEKAYALSQDKRTYIFEVPRHANKETIAEAIAAQFKVEVLNVNVANLKGKVKRTVRKGGRPIMGQRSDVRRAYVTLKEGNSIPVFAAVEEAEAKAEKIEKAAEKAAEKVAKKEKK